MTPDQLAKHHTDKQAPENADEINDMEAFVEYTREAYAHGAFGDADADEAREYAGSIQRGAKRFIDAWDAGCVRIEAPAR